MHLLRIDNIFFQVRDVEKSISFYQNLSFQLKFRIPQIPGALFHIGEEEPGLMLCKAEEPKPSHLKAAEDSACSLTFSGISH